MSFFKPKVKEIIIDDKKDDKSEEEIEGLNLDKFVQAKNRKKDQERLSAIKRKQKLAIEEIQEKSGSDLKKMTGPEKLKFILAQTEIFHQFIRGTHHSSEKGNSDVQGSPMKRRTGSKRGEMDDAEEEDANSEDMFITHWPTSPPFVKHMKMRDYQVEGLNWLIQLYDNGINGILADEMGLGKTLQTLSFLCYLKHIRGVEGPHLIIVPKSTLGNWEREFKRWVPSMKIFSFHGEKVERAGQRETLKNETFNCILTTYEISIIEKGALNKFHWQYIVMDEAHRIKNENSLLAQIVRIFKSESRLLITGTPLQNNLHELWALLFFLMPQVFSSADDWEQWFTIDSDDEQEKKKRGQDIISTLHKILRPFFLRRLKKEVDKLIPPKVETKLFVRMTPQQHLWYKKVLEKDLITLNTENGPSIRLQNILMQLRKVCNHPYLFPGAEPGPPYIEGEHLIESCGKLVVLDKLLPRLQKKESRVLIFSQMTKVLDILEDYLNFRKYNYCRLDGQTPHSERTEQIDEFNAPNSKKFVFLLSTRAGGLGINLASADVVILYDSDWNPQVDLQAQDRAHRIGQTKTVRIYRFVSEGTVEEKIIEKAEIKLRLDALVIQQGRLLDRSQALTKKEMLEMIRFGANAIFEAKDAKDITDEDIDSILAHGEEKTREMEEKFKEHEKEMAEWALGDTDTQKCTFTFAGVNYKGMHSSHNDFIGLGKRNRSAATYTENDYYRNGVNLPREKKPRKPRVKNLGRPPKQPNMHPYQFYSPRLVELFSRELELYNAKSALIEEKNSKGEEIPELLDDYELTDDEAQEKEDLLEEAFADWNRRDFQMFVKGCTEFGRKNIIDIAAIMETKTLEETRQYSKVFWQRYQELPDWERIESSITKGEQKIEQNNVRMKALYAKVESYANPWLDLHVAGSSTTNWTKDEDTFLLCLAYKYGLNWEKIHLEATSAWQFSFDYFLRSRSQVDIERRVGTLLRILEKEFTDGKIVSTKPSRANRPVPTRFPLYGRNDDIENGVKEAVGNEIVIENEVLNEGAVPEKNQEVVVEIKIEENQQQEIQKDQNQLIVADDANNEMDVESV
jgi:SWI/SNF-related matrix-associated actin-dependent regulator of chromatin subfamily A member 5